MNNHSAEEIKEIILNIIDFIQIHYLVKRDDTEFWKWVKTNIKLTDFNKEYFTAAIIKSQALNKL